ncbi:MAG: hypothetical protein LLF92_12635 [Planctomycetaceae bacterium]|nr:hypothetical protein [Planctomycetaceae bacterium]
MVKAAEESASASKKLSAQAEQMNQIVQDLATLVGRSSTNQTFAAEDSGKGRKKKLTALDHSIHQITENVEDTIENRFAN